MTRHKVQTTLARELRQQQTEAEKALWSKLRSKQLEGSKFRRQEPIGPYIVDFVNFESKLVVEVDGGHHNEARAQQEDKERTDWLIGQGFRVLRFWNNEVSADIASVVEKIEESLK